MYSVFLHKPAAKKINKLPRNLKEKIRKCLDLLANQPQVIVHAIGSRGDIYK
jgi:mRNA-degrading endonuclease RelE of RelBE toxin-antitoxin system